MSKKIIALDAGHGMNTAGKRCLKGLDPNETREWYLNDRIMDMVEAGLAAYDCRVIRVGDTTGAKDVSLSSRVRTANAAKADIYISMHHNAGLKGRSGGGTVVYYSSSKAERAAQAQKLYNAIVSKTGLWGNRSRKVIKNGFYVIKNTTMPAFLVENGFMDSPDDVPVILSEAHAQKTAEGVMGFVVDMLQLQPKTDEGGGADKNSAPAKPQESVGLPYTIVNKGESLSAIGKRLGVDWKAIADVNGISNPYTVYVGQKLYIPINTSEALYYPAYTGKTTTLSAAMTTLGINSTYSYRKQIAAANGIKGYIGTASQNTEMYNLLVAGVLKRA